MSQSIQSEMRGGGMLLSPIIASTCCTKVEAGICLYISFPSLMDYGETKCRTPARQPQRHASGPFRAVCKSTVKFHFSNPFNQKQGNKASW